MRRLLIPFLTFCSALGGQTPAPAPAVEMPRVTMPDGQITSHVVQVFIQREILPSQKPELRLLRSHEITKKTAADSVAYPASDVATGYEWTEEVDGTKVPRRGTLLLFDLSRIDFQYKSMLRVRPVVSWTEGDARRLAVGREDVNLGNISGAVGWTCLVVGITLVVLVLLAWRAGTNPMSLFAGVDGHLSLAQLQLGCWTVAVGAVVLGYGFIRREIPDIPPPLLVLMGASLATGGLGYFQDSRHQDAAEAAGKTTVRRGLSLGDLVRVFKTGQMVAPLELSLAKAQMVFWTVLLLVLFLSKSILDGEIWAVPWPLVALMGFSQAGFLAPKLVPPTPPAA